MTAAQVEDIVRSVRQMSSADYNERQELQKKAARLARAMFPKLDKRQALLARPAFFAVLEMPLSGTCVPQCCDASWIRAIQIEAKREALVTWRRIDPEVGLEIRPMLVADLVIPTSNHIALAAVELLARSPEAARLHLATIVRALEHPRWQVVECTVRILGRLGADVKKQAVPELMKVLRHSQWQVRQAAAKAMGRMMAGPNERLQRLAEKDEHPGVRYAAKKALGLKSRPT